MENVLLPILTFIAGILAGLLYKYSDIVSMKKDIEHLKDVINVMDVVELSSNVKTMKDSIIYTPGFQSQLATICSEYKGMREKIDDHANRLSTIEANMGSGVRLNFGQK